MDLQLLLDKFPNLVFKFADFSWFVFAQHTGSIERWMFWKTTISSAFVIAAISLLETMISAKVAGNMTHTKYNQTKETFGAAMANLVSGLLGGLPTSAVLIRTALNVKS